MNFELDADDRALVDGVREVCARHFPEPRALDRNGWRALTEAGVFGLTELGVGMTGAVLAFEELGRALVPGPLAGTFTGRARGATEEIITLYERGDPVVEHFEASDVVGVLDGEGVWAVEPAETDAEQVSSPLDPYTPIHRVKSLPQGRRIAGPEVAASIRRDGALLTAAYLCGIARATTDMAVAHAKERQQFGRAIGSFQAIKHICADMLVHTEIARAAVHAAGCTLDDPGAGDPARAVAAAKLLATDAALVNAKACVQVHGGMGFTWEMPVHLYLKRAAVLATQFGSTDEDADVMAACL